MAWPNSPVDMCISFQENEIIIWRFKRMTVSQQASQPQLWIMKSRQIHSCLYFSGITQFKTSKQTKNRPMNHLPTSESRLTNNKLYDWSRGLTDCDPAGVKSPLSRHRVYMEKGSENITEGQHVWLWLKDNPPTHFYFLFAHLSFCGGGGGGAEALFTS